MPTPPNLPPCLAPLVREIESFWSVTLARKAEKENTMNFDLPDSAICYADSARGVFIPQHFAESVNRFTVCEWSKWVSYLDILCQGPDTESYWDIWCSVLDSLTLTDPDSGITYRLIQDGDLWLVPDDWQPCED